MEIKLLGNVLKAARKAKRFSRDRLIIELDKRGIKASSHQLQKWESGLTTRQLVLFFSLCKILDIRPEEIILIKEQDDDNNHFDPDNIDVPDSPDIPTHQE